MRTPIWEKAKGKWVSILPSLGVSAEFLSGRHGPCPICAPGGAGKDRFRFADTEGTGRWFCNQCGSGTGLDLVKAVNGWDFKQAAEEVEKALPDARIGTKVRIGRPEREVRAEMNAIWRAGKPVEAVSAARLWWGSRVGEIPVSGDLRAVGSLRCPGHGDFPAVVAMVRDQEGKPVSLHRTFLSADGRKADIPTRAG